MRCLINRKKRRLIPKRSINWSLWNHRQMWSRRNWKMCINRLRIIKGRLTVLRISNQVDWLLIKWRDLRISSRRKQHILKNWKISYLYSQRTLLIIQKSSKTMRERNNLKTRCLNTTIKLKSYVKRFETLNKKRKERWRMPKNNMNT